MIMIQVFVDLFTVEQEGEYELAEFIGSPAYSNLITKITEIAQSYGAEVNSAAVNIPIVHGIALRLYIDIEPRDSVQQTIQIAMLIGYDIGIHRYADTDPNAD